MKIQKLNIMSLKSYGNFLCGAFSLDMSIFRHQIVTGIRFQTLGCVRFIVYAMNACSSLEFVPKTTRENCRNLLAAISVKFTIQKAHSEIY